MTTTTTALGALSVAALLLTAGCSGSNGIDLGGQSTTSTSASTSPATSPAPTTSSPDDAIKQAVLQQYLAYWKTADQVGANPSEDKKAVAAAYAPVAADPLLSSNVDAIVNLALAGQVGYGERKPLQPEIQLDATDPTTATIQDCVDTSGNGAMDKATGEKLTVGAPRAWSLSKAVKGSDGVWRFNDVTFDDTKTC